MMPPPGINLFQSVQRCCSGVLRDRTHPRRAQLASFPTVTEMASASLGSHHFERTEWKVAFV
jgi:hypothetical protein